MHRYSRASFTKQTDVLPQDLVKSLSREIRLQTFLIALKIDRHLAAEIAAEMPVKFQNDMIIIISNFVASWIHEMSW